MFSKASIFAPSGRRLHLGSLGPWLMSSAPVKCRASVLSALRDASLPSYLSVQAANALRKRFRIKVKGGGGAAIPPPLRNFAALESSPGCPIQLTDTLGSQLGCLTPTPIQRQTVPAMLAGLELLAVAPTGPSTHTHTHIFEMTSGHVALMVVRVDM